MEQIALESIGIEVIDGDRGKNYPHQDELMEKGDCLFLSAKNVTTNGFDFTENQFISAEKDSILRNGKLKRGDIVITTRGTVGNVGLYDNSVPYDSVRINSGMLIVRCNDSVSQEYLYNVLRSQWFYQKIKAMQTGSAQPQLPKSHFLKMEIPLPNKNVQDKIADIIMQFDKKIHCNNQINRNLSELLAAMYKHDYLEEIANHEDWVEVTMDDITSKFATGLNPRKNFVLGHGENYYVTIKNMNNNRVYLDSKCDMVDDEALVKINKRSNLQVGDLLFSGIGTIGRVHLIDDPPTNWNISESVFTMRPTENVSSEFLYLLLLSYDMQDYAVSLASGSVQKGIRMADLKRYKLYLPSKDDMDKLTSAWKPLINQIKKHEKENDELAILRDTLLPKLMSGELDVSDLDI